MKQSYTTHMLMVYATHLWSMVQRGMVYDFFSQGNHGRWFPFRHGGTPKSSILYRMGPPVDSVQLPEKSGWINSGLW